MITLERIQAEIIKFPDEDQLPENLVAVAVKVDDLGLAFHSGLIIGVDGVYHLFHYGGNTVDLEDVPIDEWYLCKELEIVDGQEFSLSFLAHCQNILSEESPNYGQYYDGSYYDEDGKYFNEAGTSNFTTCVGFCIKVITGFIHKKEQYFELSDWDNATADSFYHNIPQFYFDVFIKKFKQKNPKVSEGDFRKAYKRISPSEYTASAFITDLPIRREAIQNILVNVDSTIKSKRLAS